MKTNSLLVNYPITDNHPILEVNPRVEDKVEKENAREGVSVEEIVEYYAPVLEEVPIFELENQKEVDMESEDEDIEIVWGDEEPTCGNILDPSCVNVLENSFALVENTLDTCVDDSPLK